MLSKFFIDRPVFAAVLSIIITLSGVLAMRSLPISQYPDVVPPQVVVRATYPGASAEDIATTVAAPLETAINGVEGMIYMTSTSSDSGEMELDVTFKIGTDPEQATIDVNNRVQSALSQLPSTVQQSGVTVRKQSTSILQVLTLYSPNQKFDTTFISNYMLVNIIDPLKRVDGVGDARLFSTEDYSMRIWLDPAKMARYDITTTDIKNAISEQNSQFAAGSFGARPYGGADIAFTYTASTAGRFSNPKQFKNIILKSTDDGRVLRLKDVARIELGPQSYATQHSFNGQPAVPAAIYLQPGANALATAQRVRDEMKSIGKKLPQGLKYQIPFNTTQFVHASIEEVVFTFFISLMLVIAVIYLFLQNFWATLIPMLAVPVAVVGAFAGIYMLGFSINLLTLFGMVLAIGLVVDDAIIVIENIERIMTEERAPPRQAAIKAMEEVTGPVVAVVLALNAVFVPVGFLGGLSGQMYSQFAITIAVSVVISGFVALTLTPALCALFLKPSKEKKNFFFRKFNQGFQKAANAYLWGVNFLLKRAILGVLMFVGVMVSIWLVSTQVPSGLIPQEDQGYVFAVYQLPPGASLQRTEAVSQKLTKKINKSMPGVQNVISVPGFDFLSRSPRTWAGVAFLTLKDWGDRDSSSFDIVNKTFGIGAQIPAAQVLAFNPPPILGLSTTGGFEGYLQSLQGANYNKLYQKAQKFVAAANKRPELQRVRTTLSTDVPRYKVSVDREKAKALGVSISDLFSTLQATFGELYVNQFTLPGPQLAGAHAGRRAVSHASGRSAPGVREVEQDGRHDSGQFADQHQAHDLGRRRGAFQRVPGGQDHGLARAGLQRWSGQCGDPGRGQQGAGARLSVRVHRHGLSVGAYRQLRAHRAVVRRDHGVPDPGGAVREVDAAAGGDHGRAVRGAGRLPRGLVTRGGQQHLLHRGAAGAHRAGGEERDPDRGIRRARRSNRQVPG